MPDRPPRNPTLIHPVGTQNALAPTEADVYATAYLVRAKHGNATVGKSVQTIGANPPGSEAGLWEAAFLGFRGTGV
jgi:hypothetical protein